MGVGIDQLIRYEQGELDDDEVIELFQGLLDTGMPFQLQGHYGRTTIQFLNDGLIDYKWRTTHGRRPLY